MANKKRNKYPSQSKMISDARRYVIKSGEYNGASPTQDFMVTGHSTGSPYSEMEEISEQLTRDVGGLPYKSVEFGDDQGETGYDDYQGEGLGDLGGPDMYGNKPSLLKKSPLHTAGTSRGLAIGAAIGLAASAVLGGLAYVFYKSSKDEEKRASRSKSASHKASRVAAQAAVVRRSGLKSPALKTSSGSSSATRRSPKRSGVVQARGRASH